MFTTSCIIYTHNCAISAKDFGILRAVIDDFDTIYEDLLDSPVKCWLCDVGKNQSLKRVREYSDFNSFYLCSFCSKKVLTLNMRDNVFSVYFVGLDVPLDERDLFAQYILNYGYVFNPNFRYPLFLYANFVRMESVRSLDVELDNKRNALLLTDFLNDKNYISNKCDLVSGIGCNKTLGEIFGTMANNYCPLKGGSQIDGKDLDTKIDKEFDIDKEPSIKVEKLVAITNFNDSRGSKRRGYVNNGKTRVSGLKNRKNWREKNKDLRDDSEEHIVRSEVTFSSESIDADSFVSNVDIPVVVKRNKRNRNNKKRNKKRKAPDYPRDVSMIEVLDRDITVPGLKPIRSFIRSLDCDPPLYIDKHRGGHDKVPSTNVVAVLDSFHFYYNEMSRIIGKMRGELDSLKELESKFKEVNEIRTVFFKSGVGSVSKYAVRYISSLNERLVIPNTSSKKSIVLYVTNNPFDLFNFGDSGKISDNFINEVMKGDNYAIINLNLNLEFYNINDVPVRITVYQVDTNDSYALFKLDESYFDNSYNVEDNVKLIKTFSLLPVDSFKLEGEHSFNLNNLLFFSKIGDEGHIMNSCRDKQRLIIRCSVSDGDVVHGLRVRGDFRFGILKHEHIFDPLNRNEVFSNSETFYGLDCEVCDGTGCGTAYHTCSKYGY